MADTIQRVDYFYTMVPDKPGEAARMLAVLREAGVNLLVFSGFPEGRRGRSRAAGPRGWRRSGPRRRRRHRWPSR